MALVPPKSQRGLRDSEGFTVSNEQDWTLQWTPAWTKGGCGPDPPSPSFCLHAMEGPQSYDQGSRKKRAKEGSSELTEFMSVTECVWIICSDIRTNRSLR